MTENDLLTFLVTPLGSRKVLPSRKHERSRAGAKLGSDAYAERIHASQISSDFIARYVRTPKQEGAALATIIRELGVLRRAFRLAQSAGKVAFRPEISMLPEDNRREDFFEAAEYQAVLDNLSEQRFAQLHRRQRDRITAVVNEEP